MLIELILLIIATIYDFIKREIPDTLSYSLIVYAIVSKIILGGEIFAIFAFALISLGIGFYLTYKNMWGGADAKFLIAFAVLYSDTKISINNEFVIYFMNFLVCGFVFATLYFIIKVFQNLEKIRGEFSSLKSWKNYTLLFCMLAIIVLPVINLIKFVLIMTILLLSLIINQVTFEKIEKKVFVKHSPPAEITQGDILEQELTISGIEIENKPLGLNKEDVRIIHEKGKENIWIRWGIPFIPVFLISYLITEFNLNIVDLVLMLTR